jgi:ubiquinone/menaquinone biosynthesis C-methylase UbiE
MAVASHLGIRLDEYDERIRTFIPGYEAMLDAAAEAAATAPVETPHIVDLGTGTGALTRRVLLRVPSARMTGIDADADILSLAAERLKDLPAVPSFVTGDFTNVPLPACDGLVASLALHHIRTADAKRLFYRRCHAALPRGGVLVSADCCPATDPRLEADQFGVWRRHLRQTYSETETDGYFAAWADEDVYFALADELSMLGEAGFATEVVWRAGPMAVILGRADG